MTSQITAVEAIPASLLRHELLSRADEFELARRWETAVHADRLLADQDPRYDRQELQRLVELGSTARELMIAGNLRLVATIAGESARRSRISAAELFGEGVLGLVDAVDRFDPRRGVRLGTWAAVQIRSRVSAAVCTRAGELPIGLAVQLRRIRAAVERGAATDDELGELLGHPARQLVELQWGTRPEPVEQLTERPDPVGNRSYRQVLDRETGRRLLAGLDEEQRRVIMLRFGFTGIPWSRPAIGRELGIPTSRVRRLETHALARLRHLRAAA